MKKLLATIAAAASIGAAGFGVTTVLPAGASTPPPATSTASSPPAQSTAAQIIAHANRGRVRSGALKVAAQVLGMSVEDVKAQLAQGTSLAELADAKGVTSASLQQSLVDEATKRIDAAVARGSLTQRRADRLKARLATFAEKVAQRRGK